MFDDSFDGNGDPMHIPPMFRQDLAAPFGSGGEIARLDDFNNLVYTVLLDQTNLTTPGGRALLHKLGGAAGDEIADEYVKVLAATGVTGYPFIKATPRNDPNGQSAPAGLRVDESKLRDLNAFLSSLPAPMGARIDRSRMMAGRRAFENANCTRCHNAHDGAPTSTAIIPMKEIFPGDSPMVLAQRTAPLTPIMDTPGNTFDDKMAVVNASMRGKERGVARALLLDLARKPVFLHDNSVPSLDALLDPSRGSSAPHPFFVHDAATRALVVDFLRGLDTRGNSEKK